MGSKAPLNVTIQSGHGINVYNVTAASRDGPLSYEDMIRFAATLNLRPAPETKHPLPQHLDEVGKDARKKDPTPLGTYLANGVPVEVSYSGSQGVLTLNGVPSQILNQLCVQPEVVANLTLGRYRDSTGRYKMRKNAERSGIKVTD